MENLLLLIYMLVFFVVFIAATELLRRYKRIALIFFLVCLPSTLVPNADLFMKIKTISVLVPICILLYARFIPKNINSYFKIIYAVIILNIIEASVIDFTTENYLNIISGIALIVLLPYSMNKWKVSGQHDDFIVNLPKYWPLLYTVWNLCFLYSFRISTFGYAIPLLLAPYLYSVVLKRSDLYFQARAYSFGFYLFFRATFGDTDLLNIPEFNLEHWYSESVALAWALINLVIAFYCFFLALKKRNSEKKQLLNN